MRRLVLAALLVMCGCQQTSVPEIVKIGEVDGTRIFMFRTNGDRVYIAVRGEHVAITSE